MLSGAVVDPSPLTFQSLNSTSVNMSRLLDKEHDLSTTQLYACIARLLCDEISQWLWVVGCGVIELMWQN